MKKNVWIFNHYATNMYKDRAGRHYWFAKNLILNGYKPVIFCSSFMHKGNENFILNPKEKYTIIEEDNIKFVFIKTSPYKKNNIKRIKNILEYFIGILKNSKSISAEIGVPDVIIGSSVHPFACAASIIEGKKFKCKKIVEIRDLWPETLVALGALSDKSFITKLLYYGEKWIYKSSDQIIFTFEGGRQYIKDKKWDNEISLDKVFYINNGIDIDKFDYLKNNMAFEDRDLDEDTFKFIYTGTIGTANGIDILVKSVENLGDNYRKKIKFLIYGRGEKKEELENYCKAHGLSNIIFKGFVPKDKIPYILSKGDVLVVIYSAMDDNKNVLRYGGSHNKLFEYLAAGKPILYAQKSEYNIVKKNNCGLIIENKKNLSEGIIELFDRNKAELIEMGNSARKTADKFDFKILTEKLIEVIEK